MVFYGATIASLVLRREIWIFRCTWFRISLRARKSKTRTFNGACAVLAKAQIQIPLKYIGKILAKFGVIYFFAKNHKFLV